MATELKTSQKKALKGLIREIKDGLFASYLICVEIQGEDKEVVSELSKEEVERLNLVVGDTVDLFPVDIDTYLIVGSLK